MVGEDDENEVAFAAAVMIVVGTSTLDGKNEVWRKRICHARNRNFFGNYKIYKIYKILKNQKNLEPKIF
jgi:hypothetical protein